MPNNEVNGQVLQLHPGSLVVGQHMDECELKAEIFIAKYPEHYTGVANADVHPKISGMMQSYNKKFSELRISNLCKLSGVNIYLLPSENGLTVRTDRFACATCSR